MSASSRFLDQAYRFKYHGYHDECLDECLDESVDETLNYQPRRFGSSFMTYTGCCVDSTNSAVVKFYNVQFRHPDLPSAPEPVVPIVSFDVYRSLLFFCASDGTPATVQLRCVAHDAGCQVRLEFDDHDGDEFDDSEDDSDDDHRSEYILCERAFGRELFDYYSADVGYRYGGLLCAVRFVDAIARRDLGDDLASRDDLVPAMVFYVDVSRFAWLRGDGATVAVLDVEAVVDDVRFGHLVDAHDAEGFSSVGSCSESDERDE